MARAIWKGAISFGLVHIPVALVSATSSQGVDFDWLDDRSMEPVGYKRVNKVTGKEVPKQHITKGVKYEKGRYVILSEEEIRTAHPKSTQTIDIFAFVGSDEIPLANIDKPYYLSPNKRGEKVYALLRETLIETGKVALARVVIRTRQHLAAVMPVESALTLMILRWPTEVRDLDVLDLDDKTTSPELSKSEMTMARRLVEDMTAQWQPDEYHDTFQEEIMNLVEQKAREGEIENVEGSEEIEERKSANVIDLTELLKRSLRGKGSKADETATGPEDEEDSEDEQESEDNSSAGKKTAVTKSASKSNSKKTRAKTAKAPRAKKNTVTKGRSTKTKTTRRKASNK